MICRKFADVRIQRVVANTVIETLKVHFPKPSFSTGPSLGTTQRRVLPKTRTTCVTVFRCTRRKRWFGKMDFQRFYDSVCHNTLQKMICRKFADVRIQRLLWQIIDDFHHSPGRGIPIGALTSQYFGNFYLDAFDRQLRASGRCRRMLRYMDDVLVFGDRDDLRQIRGLAYQAAENLRLSTKHGGVWNRCDRGVPYLGFVLYPDRIRVNREGRKRFGRRIGAVMRDLRRGQITDRAAQDCMRSLVAHTDFANDVAWRRSVLDRKQECDA
ncbi:MAG: RNA-directed DNA polymerase [Planctomycetota bacterium]